MKSEKQPQKEPLVTYRQVGDYMIPNFELPNMEVHGKYANLRKNFLKKHREAVYTYLTIMGTLADHCNEIGRKAEKMEDKLIEQMIKAEPMLTEELKARDQMKWVGLMNNIRLSAEEIVLKELIYT